MNHTRTDQWTDSREAYVLRMIEEADAGQHYRVLERGESVRALQRQICTQPLPAKRGRRAPTS
jgi:hypothetical protein